MVCLSLTKIGILEARTASKTADEHPHDDSRILTCLRRRLELLSPATLPLCETFGLGEWFSLFLELARGHPHSTSPLWHSPSSSFRFGHRTFWICFEPSPPGNSGDATPPLPCFYPHSKWAASGPGARWGSI